MTVRSGTRFGSLIALRSVGRDEGRILCVCTRCQHAVTADTGALRDGLVAACDCGEPPILSDETPVASILPEILEAIRRLDLWEGRGRAAD